MEFLVKRVHYHSVPKLIFFFFPDKMRGNQVRITIMCLNLVIQMESYDQGVQCCPDFK